MPLVDMKDLLTHAFRNGYAVGAFEAPSLEFLEGILSAAEDCRSPVIISLTESNFTEAALACRLAAMESAARRATVPVATHLNRGTSYASAVRAIGLGCNSVMVDTSSRHFPDNVAETRRIAETAHGCGITVEGALGCVLGGEQEGPAENRCSADEATAYVQRTGVDCLGVSIGRASSNGRARLRLDFDILKRLHETAPIPLVLHSLAELTDEQYHKLILHGVAAIHAPAALNGAVASTVRAQLHAQDADGAIELRDTHAALADRVERCMRLWGSAGRAAEVLMQCQAWQPVEHLILYNADGANATQIATQVAAMMAHGQEVLSRIPGVRRVFAGRAIPHPAHYQYCWLVQFAHPKVIDSYQNDPEYVAFANQYLRPLAQDRITIDFAATAGASGQGVSLRKGAPNRRASTLGLARHSGAQVDS